MHSLGYFVRHCKDHHGLLQGLWKIQTREHSSHFYLFSSQGEKRCRKLPCHTKLKVSTRKFDSLTEFIQGTEQGNYDFSKQGPNFSPLSRVDSSIQQSLLESFQRLCKGDNSKGLRCEPQFYENNCIRANNSQKLWNTVCAIPTTKVQMQNCFCKRLNISVNIQRSIHSDILRNLGWSQNESARKGQRHNLSTRSSDRSPVLNPLKELQPHVAVPLIPEGSHLFDPSYDEIIEAQKIFIPQEKGSIKFLKSAVYTEQLPEYDLPEVAFIGRSNVGKSSLIKALFTAADEDVKIRTSKTPGQTKTLHFFQVGDFFSAVDMPGYGHNMPTHFVDSAEQFLKTRRKLCRTFVLVDATTGVTRVDNIGLDMVEEFGIPYVMTFLLVDGKIGMTPLDVKYFEKFEGFSIQFCIVMTKIDKVAQSILVKNLMSIIRHREKSSFCFLQPFICSSITGDGLALLQAFIAYITGNVQIKGL